MPKRKKDNKMKTKNQKVLKVKKSYVLIRVQGGVAEVIRCPKNVNVVIDDRDINE